MCIKGLDNVTKCGAAIGGLASIIGGLLVVGGCTAYMTGVYTIGLNIIIAGGAIGIPGGILGTIIIGRAAWLRDKDEETLKKAEVAKLNYMNSL